MTLTMFHNPSCGTSRKVLEAIGARGLDVEVVAYLKTPPNAATLHSLIDRLDGDVADLIRNDPHFKDLGFDAGDYTTPDAVVALLVEHPRLMQRPLLATDDTVIIARPPAAAEAFLDGLSASGSSGNASSASAP
jgi:arsenate reductase (glutaredoxin)